MKEKQRIIVITLAWLLVPCCLVLFYFFAAPQSHIFLQPTVVAILFACLFFSAVFVVVHRINTMMNSLSSLREKLAEQEARSFSLKEQLEENIEKRVYELQIINGSLNREIAERIQAEQEVLELQKKQSLILNSAGEGILGLDNIGRVTFLNTAASLMLGWEPEELIGQQHHPLIHHSLADGTENPVDKCPIYMAYKDGLVHFNTGDIFWCKNGTSFPVEYSSTPINDEGILTGAVVVFRDLSTFS